MTTKTASRVSLPLRLAALAVLPVLALSVACDAGEGVRASGDEAIATAPATTAPTTAPAGTTGTADADGPSARPTGKSAFYDAQMAYVRCMRGKAGYKNFPDPKLSGHLDWEKVNEVAEETGQMEASKGGRNGVCTPEFRTVMLAEPPRDQQKDYESMLAHAKCMRDNGVTRFTNPTMSSGHAQPGGDPNPVSPGIDQQSPSYKKARQACRTKLLDGLDGMQ
ncbi:MULTISPECIES: hypothetical protein [unclassified Streptomyces]|uniref:hypothetical protein n=1 Tax=unclassified Streptomyces TaxID=2593676 RepID=UPI0016612145|nr:MULTISPECIES: hypothetical protein [unclassified Streptomyces]MBD0710463.1 hypothetical protein [Streptomyces sp. CBMA291]MBD0712798.1 hypothetical protein [Streptomyces sp. CBMA370]